MAKAKFMYVTECRYLNGEPKHKKWHEDSSTTVWDNKESALEDALKCTNKYPSWQYRVVRYSLDGVETEKIKEKIMSDDEQKESVGNMIERMEAGKAPFEIDTGRIQKD